MSERRPFGTNQRLSENIMHFGRILRSAGLPVGPAKVIDAVRAVEVVGVRRRDDFYWTLNSIFVDRREHQTLFDQAFEVFWRDPHIMDRLMQLLLPKVRGLGDEKSPDVSLRLAEALAAAGEENDREREPEEERIEVEASLTFSSRELLQTKDFEAMSTEEAARAKEAIARLRLPIAEVATRRFKASGRGRFIDLRATMRASLRGGGSSIPLKRRNPARRHPPLVVLCDISGSMSQYSRMFLHFMHAVTNDRDRVHTLLFGTRLTNVSRYLRYKDVDVALDHVSKAVADWAGGTRIGACLHEFNLRWSRRLLGQGAVVLLVSDGLDRDAGEGIAAEMERLHKSARRVIWLNPLLRFGGFEPRAAGVRALLPYVDDFRPVHNIQSLSLLAQALSRPPRAYEDAGTRGRAA